MSPRLITQILILVVMLVGAPILVPAWPIEWTYAGLGLIIGLVAFRVFSQWLRDRF
jgi:hypothetical protein